MLVEIEGHRYKVQKEVAMAIHELIVRTEELEMEIALRDVGNMYNLNLN